MKMDEPLPVGEPRPPIPDPFLAAFGLPPEPPAPPAVVIGAWVRGRSTWHQVSSVAPFRSPLGGVVSEMLGHTSVAITLDRYSHVIPTMQAEAVRRLDGVLNGRLRVQMRVQRRTQPRKSPDSRSESG